jgi:hypothetical protein
MPPFLYKSGVVCNDKQDTLSNIMQGIFTMLPYVIAEKSIASELRGQGLICMPSKKSSGRWKFE